jgi:hypothetical protein
MTPGALRRQVARTVFASVPNVHLVDLRRASTVPWRQVLTGADVLHATGGAEAEAVLHVVLAGDARLDEERRPILRDVRERGRVHGR